MLANCIDPKSLFPKDIGVYFSFVTVNRSSLKVPEITILDLVERNSRGSRLQQLDC